MDLIEDSLQDWKHPQWTLICIIIFQGTSSYFKDEGWALRIACFQVTSQNESIQRATAQDFFLVQT